MPKRYDSESRIRIGDYFVVKNATGLLGHGKSPEAARISVGAGRNTPGTVTYEVHPADGSRGVRGALTTAQTLELIQALVESLGGAMREAGPYPVPGS